MSALEATAISKAHTDRAVLRGCDLLVDAGERVGLVGPNGCGKSTLLRICGGLEEADGGSVVTRGRVAILHQEPRLEGQTVGEAVAVALSWHAALLTQWRDAIAAGEERRTAELQGRLDLVGWDLDHRVDAVLDRLHAPPRDALVTRLSGGEKRRAALARVLLSEPDVLLLDEPTNHLDAATIDRLQDDLLAFGGALVLVTHDRYLLEALATRIVEIEDGVTVSYDGTYADYLIARAERQAALRRTEDARLAMIAREAVWASRSPAARTTKQRARLDRLEVLRSARALPREPSLSLDLSTGLKQGQTVIEARGLAKAWGGQPLFSRLDLALLRGERLGVIGENGTGKSTLLHVLAGSVSPDAGAVTLAPRVRAALLDQHRTGLRDDDTVFEAAGDGNDRVQVGERWVHVHGLLDRFLFSRSLHDQRVAALSGGERARLLLVRTMLQGANLLLLDEPTNDLDLLTLRVLEEALLSFDGSAVIVTHDRAFLDRVCTGVLAFEGDGRVVRYASREQAARGAVVAPAAPPPRPAEARPREAARRLSWKEKRELEELPDRLSALEAEVASLEAALADPAAWRDRGERAAALRASLDVAQTALATGWARWEDLESRAG